MRILLYSYAALFTAQGIAYFLFPTTLLGVLGASFDSAPVTTELRATYAGIHFGMAALVALNTESRQSQLMMLDTLTALIAGVVVVRAAGIWIDGGSQTLNTIATASELASVVVTILCARRLRQAQRERRPAPAHAA